MHDIKQLLMRLRMISRSIHKLSLVWMQLPEKCKEKFLFVFSRSLHPYRQKIAIIGTIPTLAQTIQELFRLICEAKRS
jgi:hypothetical protein